MARPRSERVEDVKSKLVERIQDGHHRPGERFLSNRALAARFQLSYQTADRLIRELCSEGLLERRPASGTYLPGRAATAAGVCLCFHSRSRRPNSLGAALLEELKVRLHRENIPFAVRFDDETDTLTPNGWFPVFWEWERPRPTSTGLILHRRPPSGLDSTFWDSVSVDDYSGGVCAAQLLMSQVPTGSRWAMISGPDNDERSRARRDGFCSVLSADVVAAGWFAEDAENIAPLVLEMNPSGIFCANDRLAEGLMKYFKREGKEAPPIVGFDDAPIACELGLTTIAIPWSEMLVAAMNAIRQRLADPRGTGTHQVVSPRPVIRW